VFILHHSPIISPWSQNVTNVTKNPLCQFHLVHIVHFVRRWNLSSWPSWSRRWQSMAFQVLVLDEVLLPSQDGIMYNIYIKINMIYNIYIIFLIYIYIHTMGGDAKTNQTYPDNDWFASWDFYFGINSIGLIQQVLMEMMKQVPFSTNRLSSLIPDVMQNSGEWK
jgi:hypothetical protein